MMKKASIQRSQLKDEDISTIYQFCNKECRNKDSSFSDALTVMIGIASSITP